jgi:Icc-related predicted phosphoesterase
LKLWIFSDIHLEFGDIALPDPVPDADVCVVAGDILTRGIVPSLEWLAARVAPLMPVIFTAGNHEFYRSFLTESLEAASAFEDAGRVHFLEDRAVEIGDVVFCGCTLWSDFDVLGEDWAEPAMREAMRSHNDYRAIRYRKQPFSRLWPVHTRNKHVASRKFLEDCLEKYAGREIVFVTHHAPSLASAEARFRQDLLTPAYVSDLTALMGKGGPKLWVHGHTHHAVDYVVGGTRVVCNPRGYPGESSHENFDFNLAVDV